MKIAILGTGAVASRLFRLFAAAGHGVVLGSRDPVRARERVPSGIEVAALRESVSGADLTVIAVPFTAAAEILTPLAPALIGRVVVDATNPLRDDYGPIELEHGRSAGETIAALLPGARIVKAWNTIFADVMTPEGRTGPAGPVSLFLASDDQAALDVVADLGREAGFAPVPAGPLRNSRYLEAMAHLNIHLAFGERGGTNAAFIYERRGATG